MATENTKATGDTSEQQPIFTHFSWHRQELESANLPGTYLTSITGAVRDISSGVGSILELLEKNEMERECYDDQQIIFDRYVASNLARLAIRSLEMLNAEAERLTNHAWEIHTPEGRADAKARMEFRDNTI